jgi:hypothetical protein
VNISQASFSIFLAQDGAGGFPYHLVRIPALTQGEVQKLRHYLKTGKPGLELRTLRNQSCR